MSRTDFSDETKVALDLNDLLLDFTTLRFDDVIFSQGVARMVVRQLTGLTA
jgi:hypothetical protein